jgi:signal transduction histidine kinase
LNNALDTTPDGGQIRLEVAADAGLGGQPMVVVRVHDSGTGISDSVRVRIFEPFFTTKYQGTGLGLCIAARIVASQKGRLVLESTGRSGTTFAVWIPAAPTQEHPWDES